MTSWAWARWAAKTFFRTGLVSWGLVEEEEVGFESRFGQGPHLQVVVVFEADHTLLGVVQVGPGLAGERKNLVRELGVLGGSVQAAQVRYVVAGQGAVGGLAVAGHGTQHGVGQRPGADLMGADADRAGDAECLAGLPAGWRGLLSRLV
jgi:hypothetical protein